MDLMVLKVRDLMSPDVETLFDDETLDLANTILTLGRIRHLPVTNRAGKIIGLITQRDLQRAVAWLYKEYGTRADEAILPVTEMMTKDVMTIGPDEPALKAAELIWENKFGCLPIVEGDVLVGILTESDFVRHAINELSSTR